MPKVYLTYLLILVSLKCFGQTPENTRFSICKAVNDTIKRTELDKCYYLYSTNKKLKIISFGISYVLKAKADKFGSAVAHGQSEGNKFSNSMREAIRKDKPDRFWIEGIVAMDGDTERKYPGFVVYVK